MRLLTYPLYIHSNVVRLFVSEKYINPINWKTVKCFRGPIGAGNNFHATVSVAGSNPLRIGQVNAVRMIFHSQLFREKKVLVKKV